MKNLKVVLNDSNLSVSELLTKGRTTVQNLTDHASVFTNPNPSLAAMTQGCDELETAIREAFDGGKSKTAIRNEKRQKLHALLVICAAYVEQVAAGDEEIVYLSGLEVKKERVVNYPDFAVEQGDHNGSVSVRVRARKGKILYRWEHSSDAATWISDGVTRLCKASINNLAKGVYWFRVILIDESGEHEQARVNFAVN